MTQVTQGTRQAQSRLQFEPNYTDSYINFSLK